MSLHEEFCEITNSPVPNLLSFAEPTKKQVNTQPNRELNHKKILLLDAENDLREVIKTGLELTTNWEILTNYDLNKSVNLVINKQPNAILLNIERKDLDEIILLLKLRKSQRSPKIPIILLLERIRLSDQKGLRELEIAGAIAKPFDMVNLGKQIAGFLDWNLEEFQRSTD